MHPIGHLPSSPDGNPTDQTVSGDYGPTDGVWMTKAQLAAVRRISVASADRLIRRQGWRKHPGNDGRARVLVPPDWAASRASGPTDEPHVNPMDEEPARPTDKATNPTDSAAGPTDIIRAVSALEAAVSTLHEQLVVASRSVDRAEAGREAERARADDLAARLAGAQAELAAAQDQAEVEQALRRAEAEATAELHRRVEAAKIAQAEAEAEAAEIRQADAARKGRGRLARLRAAWRGE
jgi:hypothetical protein